jgi:hypothetical protein
LLIGKIAVPSTINISSRAKHRSPPGNPHRFSCAVELAREPSAPSIPIA